MKKKDIVDAINKNLEVLKYEELYYIEDNAKVGNEYIIDQIGVKPVKYFYTIENMYKKLNVKGCDCKLFIHHEAPDDEFESDYDECILCHKKNEEPKRESIWFRECQEDKPFGRYHSNADIKYVLFKYILEYVKDLDDDTDIDLYKVISDYLREYDYHLLQAEYFVDNRKKDSYRMLIVLGSNEIKLGEVVTRPISQQGLLSLINEIEEEYSIKIDVLKNDGYDGPYNGNEVTSYDYRSFADVERFIDEINKDDVRYDLVLDFSNIKRVEEIDDKILLQDYSIKDKINADYYITLRDNSGMSDEEIIEDSERHDDNERIIYHDIKRRYGSLGGFKYVEDDMVRDTSCLYPLSKLILDTLLDESKVALDDKKEISKELVRTLKKTM